MLQSETGPRIAEVEQAWTEGAPRKAPPVSRTASLRTWLPVTAATAVCLVIHWFVSTTEPPAETRSYFVFLWSVLGVSLVLAAAQIGWPSLRRWMRRMGPIFAAALMVLVAWELITSGFRWLPLPYFPSPAGVFQSLINDRALLFDSTWHSLILLLSGYALGVIAGLISGICIGWSSPVRYWGMPVLKVVGPIPATAWIPLAMVVSPSAIFSAVCNRLRRAHI